jgi:tetratricopeptide (TPR) repeat protein
MRSTSIRVFRLLILGTIFALVGCGGGTPAAPADPLVHLETGLAHWQAGDWEKAVVELEAAVQADPTLASQANPALTEAHFWLGNAYAEQGQLDKAAEEFKAVLGLEANDVEAHSNLGVIYYQKGLLDEAVSEYQAALDVKPDDAEVHYLLGAAYVQMMRLDEAVKEFNIALEHDPELPEAYFGLGTVHKLQGNKEEAIEAFERFLELGPVQDPQAQVEAERMLRELKGQ